MTNQISSLSITKLHGRFNIDIPIIDNRIVLVGVNGLGKTTIVSILYYLLTRQWQRLLEYDFESIRLTVDRQPISVAREDLFSPDDIVIQESLFESLPPSVMRRLRGSQEFQRLLVAFQTRPSSAWFEEMASIARKLELPLSIVERAVMTSRGRFPMGSRKHRQKNERLEKSEKQLQGLAAQVLYLPTYRRIEQDLKSIFPEMEGDFKKILKARSSRSMEMIGGFVELVEFGMEDVDNRISARLGALKDGSRVELNNLAGGYLRDVIRGEARQWDEKQIEKLSDDEIQLILGRVEEKQLSEQDKATVFEVINRVRRHESLNGDHELLAHFFSKLVTIHEAQRTAEIPIRQFAQVCNKYLQRKELKYDDVNFQMPLVLDSGDKIELRHLSSGEKQIVSLFAHIYLGSAEKFFLIIDEPELSLSVEWQRTLLPDLLESKRCDFIAAVTHSPFTYDNSLKNYTMDLARFIEAA